MANNKDGRCLVSNHRMAPEPPKRNWTSWPVTIATLTIAIFSMTVSIVILCKLMELSDAVDNLKVTYSVIQNHEKQLVHTHGDNSHRQGERISNLEIADSDEPRYGEDRHEAHDVSDSGTLLRERRAASDLDTDKKKRKKPASRTSHIKKKKKKQKKKHSESCKIQLGSNNNGKMTFQSNKHECFDALGAYVKEKVGESRPNAPMHLVSNVSLTNEDFELVNRDRTKSIQFTHGKFDYNGYCPKDETLQFWTIPDWILMDKEAGGTYDLLPVETKVTSVKVKVSGLYFINAQVTFHTTRGHLGYHVKKSLANQQAATSQTLMTCIKGIDYVTRGNPLPEKYRSCATNGIQYLMAMEHVYIEVIDPNLPIVTRPELTFWGLIHVY